MYANATVTMYPFEPIPNSFWRASRNVARYAITKVVYGWRNGIAFPTAAAMEAGSPERKSICERP